MRKTPLRVPSGDFTSGKPTPQNIESEEMVLGCCLLDKTSIHAAAKFLKPEYFYKPEFMMVFQALLELYNEGKTIDIVVVTHKMRSLGTLDAVGGPLAITQLTNRIASTSNIELYCVQVLEEHLRRMLIIGASKVLADSYNAMIPILDTHDFVHQLYTEVLGQYVHLKAVDTQAKIEEVALKFADDAVIAQRIQSSLRDINNDTGGYGRGTLLLLGARPGMGKTSLALQDAVHQARNGVPAVFFSLEMAFDQIVNRIFAPEAEVPVELIDQGKLSLDDKKRLRTAVKNFPKNLIIDDSSSISFSQLRNRIVYYKMTQNIQIVYIDYLQLVVPDQASFNRDSDLGDISRGLKNLSKELDIPIVALSQLGRKVEERKNSVPKLSDLRESGNLEADADVVWLLYRPEYYKLYRDEDGNDLTGVAQLIRAKVRNGSPGTTNLRFIGKYTKFDNYTQYDEQPSIFDNEQQEDSPF